MAARRAGVDVEGHRCGTARGGDLFHRLDRPDLVVGPLAVDECGRLRAGPGQRVDEGVDIEAAVAVDRHDLGGGEAPGGVPHRRVFDVGGEHPATWARPGGGEDCGIDRLGAARGEDDLAAAYPEERGDGLAPLLDGHPGDAALLVDSAGITTALAEGAAIASMTGGRGGLVDAWSR